MSPGMHTVRSMANKGDDVTQGSIESGEFRAALSTFATGVTIVTAREQSGEPVGMTASSFNSVSMDPPLILWSVTKSALSAPVFKETAHFAVHVLASSQVELSNRFARSGSDKFAGLTYTSNAAGCPVLPGCIARFDCNTWQVYEGGDHWIIVGEVVNLVKHNDEGLVFCDGSYAIANPIAATRQTPATQGGSEESPVDNLLLYNLARATRQMSDRFHQAVRSSGLTVPAWRVLASLYGQTARQLPDLANRTFIEKEILTDLLQLLKEEGLCELQYNDGELMAVGTQAGHERVQHLFALGAEQEKSALAHTGDQGLSDLIALLAEVVRNTSEESLAHGRS